MIGGKPVLKRHKGTVITAFENIKQDSKWLIRNYPHIANSFCLLCWVCEDDPQSPATNFPNKTTIILAVIQNGDLPLN